MPTVSAIVTRNGETRPCERFVFLFDNRDSVPALIRHLADLVQDPELPRFTWQVAQHVADEIGHVLNLLDAARHPTPVPPTGACFTMTEPHSPTPPTPQPTPETPPANPPSDAAAEHDAAAPPQVPEFPESGNPPPTEGPPASTLPSDEELEKMTTPEDEARINETLGPARTAEAAAEMIRHLNFDTAVVAIALAGRSGNGKSAWNDFDGKRFEVNGDHRRVRVIGEKTVLYDAELTSDGLTVTTFRPGYWIDRALHKARQLEIIARQHKHDAELAATNPDRLHFEPYAA